MKIKIGGWLLLLILAFVFCVFASGGCGGSSHTDINTEENNNNNNNNNNGNGNGEEQQERTKEELNDISYWDSDYVSGDYGSMTGTWKIISGDMLLPGKELRANFQKGSSSVSNDTFQIIISPDTEATRGVTGISFDVILSGDGVMDGGVMKYITGHFRVDDSVVSSDEINKLLSYFDYAPAIAGHGNFTVINAGEKNRLTSTSTKATSGRTAVFRLQDADTIIYYMHNDVYPKTKKSFFMRLDRVK